MHSSVPGSHTHIMKLDNWFTFSIDPRKRRLVSSILGAKGNYLVNSDSVSMRKGCHLAIVFNGSALLLFVDGQLQTGPLSYWRQSDAKNQVVGRIEPMDRRSTIEPTRLGDVAPGWSTPYRGTMDELRISSAARYKESFAPAARFEPDKDTLALYHFDEGQGDVLTDSSGNGHHGKIVNAKWVPEEAAR
jgi:hypothetical protein